MNENDNGTIEERLARLERVAKRGKRVMTAVAVLVMLLIAWDVLAYTGRAWLAGLGAKDLVARSLRIIDQRGTSRVQIAVSKYGPEVIFRDETRKLRLALGLHKEGPAVVLFDEKGHGRLDIGFGNEGGPAVSLFDENRHVRLELSVDSDIPRVYLFDEKRTPRAH